MADAPKESDSADSADPSETSTADTPDELEKHPGRPRGEGELDPELMRLPKRRTKIGWLLSVAVIAFCCHWMITLRSDFAYSRAGDEPRPVPLAELLSQSSDEFISTELVPDRAQTARIYAGADLGIHASVVLGTQGSVWLVTPGSAFAGEPRYDNQYAGRLKRLGELPFFDNLRAFYADNEAPLQPIDPSALVNSVGTSVVKNVHGDTIEMKKSSRVELTWRPRGRVWIVVSPEAEGPGDSLAWRAALESKAGFEIRGTIEPKTPPRVPTWTFEVSAPEGRQAIVDRLAEVGLAAARVAPVEEIISGTWGELAADASKPAAPQLKLGAMTVPAAEVVSVLVAHRLEPDANAMVLIAGERPSDFWYMLPLYILFGLILLLFGWTLFKAVRGSMPPTVPASS